MPAFLRRLQFSQARTTYVSRHHVARDETMPSLAVSLRHQTRVVTGDAEIVFLVGDWFEQPVGTGGRVRKSSSGSTFSDWRTPFTYFAVVLRVLTPRKRASALATSSDHESKRDAANKSGKVARLNRRITDQHFRGLACNAAFTTALTTDRA